MPTTQLEQDQPTLPGMNASQTTTTPHHQLATIYIQLYHKFLATWSIQHGSCRNHLSYNFPLRPTIMGSALFENHLTCRLHSFSPFLFCDKLRPSSDQLDGQNSKYQPYLCWIALLTELSLFPPFCSATAFSLSECWHSSGIMTWNSDSLESPRASKLHSDACMFWSFPSFSS